MVTIKMKDKNFKTLIEMLEDYEIYNKPYTFDIKVNRIKDMINALKGSKNNSKLYKDTYLRKTKNGYKYVILSKKERETINKFLVDEIQYDDEIEESEKDYDYWDYINTLEKIIKKLEC